MSDVQTVVRKPLLQRLIPGERIVLASIAVLAAVVALSRFLSLDDIPHGFFIDEAAIAAHVLCIADHGTDARGHAAPLFAEVLGGGHASPTLLYPAAVWTRLTDPDIASLRSFSALHTLALGLALSIAVGVAARRRDAALLAMLIAMSSPWLFAQARIFWDPVIGASWWGIALSLYWIARNQTAGTSRQRWPIWMACGLAAAAAAYAYPPVRVQLVLSVAIILGLDRATRKDSAALAALASLAIALIPLVLMYRDSEFNQRAQTLALWSAGWADLPMTALRQLLLHLDPAFLLLKGDGNLRHSSGYGGLFGPLEITILISALALAPRFVLSRESALLCLLFIAGLLPAALTRESIPHALRSIGAIGPALLWLGLAAAAVLQDEYQKRRRILLVWLLIGTGSAALYQYDYFARFSSRSTAWFGGDTSPENWGEPFRLAHRYFELRDQRGSCDLQ